MASRAPKTRPHEGSVAEFIAAVPDAARRADCETVCALMARITGAPARLWGPSIAGFGAYRYRYDSGREGEWMVTGFAPRRRELVLYLMTGLERHAAALARRVDSQRVRNRTWIPARSANASRFCCMAGRDGK